MVAVIDAMFWVPLVAFAPLQPPMAVHEVAFAELQVSAELPPPNTTDGFAVIVTKGTTLTVTVDTLLGPPVPVHASEYVVGMVSAPVLCVPEGVLMPLQPPDAVQDVALVELHVSVELPPLATEVGAAVSVAVAVPDTVTVAVAAGLAPPAPEQVSEYDVVAPSAPVPCEPLVGLLPLQPPEAVHDVALVELHVSVEEPPSATVGGAALMDAVGFAGLLLPLPHATSKSDAQTDARIPLYVLGKAELMAI